MLKMCLSDNFKLNTKNIFFTSRLSMNKASSLSTFQASNNNNTTTPARTSNNKTKNGRIATVTDEGKLKTRGAGIYETQRMIR